MAVEDDADSGLVKDALFRQLEAVYGWMSDRAKKTPEGIKVFFGKTTRALDDQEIPRGQYSPIFNTLKELGCLRQIKRGGGVNAISEWEVVAPPRLSAYYKFKTSSPTHTTRLGSIENEIRALQVKNKKLESDLFEMYKLVKPLYEAVFPTINTDEDEDENDDLG